MTWKQVLGFLFTWIEKRLSIRLWQSSIHLFILTTLVRPQPQYHVILSRLSNFNFKSISKWQDSSAAAETTTATAVADFLEGNKSSPFLSRSKTNARRLLNTVDETTKGLPIVGGITSPLLKTVGGVTDGLPIVRLSPLPVHLFSTTLTYHPPGRIRRPKPSQTTNHAADDDATMGPSSPIRTASSVPASSRGAEAGVERGGEEGEGGGEEEEVDCVEKEAVGDRGGGVGDE